MMAKKVAELSKLLSRVHCSETAKALPGFIEQATNTYRIFNRTTNV